MFYRPYTQSSMIKNRDSLNIDLAQSNIFQKSENLEADFEITTLELTYYYPISKEIELSFNYPFYYLSSGFLDSSLEYVHSTLGIETTRENEGHINNQITYRVTDKINKDSDYYVSGSPQIEIKYLLYEESDFLVSTNLGVKIPLGSVDNGFTNAKLGLMSGVQLQKNYETISWLVNLVLTLDGERELSDDITSNQLRYFFYLANKFQITDTTHFLLAYQYSSAPYEAYDDKFSSPTHLFQFALRKKLSTNNYIDLFLNQNTIPRHNEADITIGLSYHFQGLLL